MTTTATKERPIIFSGDNPAKILRGEKTQTRRVIDRVLRFGKITEFAPSGTPGYDWHFRCPRRLWQDMRHDDFLELCPYGKVGDRLWAKESWCPIPEMKPSGYFTDPKWIDRTAWYSSDNDKPTWGGKWRSPLFMPKEHARITLEITDVRAQRLQDISVADAKAEGAECRTDLSWCGTTDGDFYGRGFLAGFRASWDAKNARRGFSWESNPWVWAITFRRHEIRRK